MKQSLIIMILLISTLPAQEKSELKNLQVLPFTKKQDVVDFMKKVVVPGLGVKCKFCHEPMDFSSDKKKNKLIAREMIKMTRGINLNTMKKLEFHDVTCFTCHAGNEHPSHPPKD